MDEKLKKTSFSALNISKQWAYLFAASMLTLAPLSASASESNNLNASKSLAVQQDKKTVSGTVVDANGEPIIGATVKEVGTQNATITDVNGTFKLNVKPGAMLTVSSVGFKEQTVKASDKVDVTLKEDAEVLEQVVVVGYGTAKRKDVSGAITSVKFDDGKLTNLPNPNALSALSSQVAGLHYSPTSSAAGDNSSTMTLRGKNVIPENPSAAKQANNAPLLIVDGVISYGGISEINTNDIATIDVLKDASAAAIYGSRAANGVIIITTKRGESAKPTVRFNSSWSFSDWSRKPEFVNNTERFLMNRFYAKQAAGDEHFPADATWSMDFFKQNKSYFFVKTTEEQAFDAGMWTNWLDEVTRTGVGQQYDLSVAGGSKGVKYYLSGDYTRRQGVQRGDDYEKYNVMSKIDIDVTDWLKVGLKANYLGWRQWGVTATLGNAEWYSPFSFKTVQPVLDEHNQVVPGSLKYTSWYNSHPDGNTLSPLWGSGVNSGVSFGNAHVKKALGIGRGKAVKPRAGLHGRRDGAHALVLPGDLAEGLAKHLGKICPGRAQGLSGGHIEGTHAVKLVGLQLRRAVALALHRFHMDQHRAGKLLCVAQHLGQLGHIVAVHRAHIGKAHLLKHAARQHSPLDGLLDDMGHPVDSPAQGPVACEAPVGLLEPEILRLEPLMGQIPRHAAHVGHDGHAVVVEDNHQGLLAGPGVCQALVGKAAGESAVPQKGKDRVVLAGEGPGPGHAQGDGHRVGRIPEPHKPRGPEASARLSPGLGKPEMPPKVRRVSMAASRPVRILWQ